MRIDAKGLHWTTVTLADGTKKTYWYAWRGGPPLRGEPGSPEFIADFNSAIATKVAAPEGRLLALTQGFQQSQDFLSLRERTRSDYIKQIAKIEQRFGDAPQKALADPRTRGIFLDWRDELALKSKRQADYAWQVLARGVLVGEGSRQDHRQPVRARRARLPRHARRLRVERGGRGGISRTCSDAIPPAALARVMDRAAAGRSLAPHVVRL